MQAGDTSQGIPQGVPASQVPSLLSPWDAYPYFQFPKESEVTVNFGLTSKQVINSDPNRVALIFSVLAGDPTVWLTTLSGAVNGHGLPVSQSVPMFLVQAVYGSLVQVEWYGSCTAAPATLRITEVRLKDWPK